MYRINLKVAKTATYFCITTTEKEVQMKGWSPLTAQVAKAVLSNKMPYFPDRNVTETDLVAKARMVILEALSGVVTPKLIHLLATDELLAAAVACFAANEFRTASMAFDPMILVPGKGVNPEWDGIYGLFADTVDGFAFAGGFGSPNEDPFATFVREALEEVLNGERNNEGSLALKWIAMEASDPWRGGKRWEKMNMHIISHLGICVPRPGVELAPLSGDDAKGFRWVQLFDESGVPAWKSVNGLTSRWRDDHHGMLSRFLKGWQVIQGLRGIDANIFDFASNLPDVTIAKTDYPPIPEAKGEYSVPNTFNVQMAKKLFVGVLAGHEVDERLATTVADKLVAELVKIGFLPLFHNAFPTVDWLVVGDDYRQESILLVKEDSLWRLPGAVVRYGETVREAALRATGKYGFHSNALHFAGMASNRLENGEFVDPRGTAGGSILMGHISRFDPRVEHEWVPLFAEKPGHYGNLDGSLNAALLQRRYAWHHDQIIRRAARDLVAQRIVIPGEEITLLEAIQRRGYGFWG